MKKSTKADLMLFSVIICWGFSFFFTDIVTGTMQAFNLNAFRFIVAFIVCAVILNKKLHNVSRETWKWTIIIGTLSAIMYAFMNIGVANTTLSHSGFLCQTSVIITPFLSAFINKSKPGFKAYILSFTCLIGVALLTLSHGWDFGSDNFIGDIACMLCGVVFSFHIVMTEFAIRKENVDALQVSVLQLAVTGIISLIVSFCFETPVMPDTLAVCASALFLAVFCTGLGIVFQTLAQRNTPASHVSIIFSLEPVIAGFVAYIFAGEILSVSAYIGAALMIFAVFAMEIDFKKIIKK